MKSITLLFLQCFFAFQVFAQSRYLEEIFPDVKISNDVIYGSNATILSDYSFGALRREDLKMDVYEPINDTLQERPLVLVLHSGFYLPPIVNGSIIGSKEDSSVVEICTQLARRGFTAASVTYRQGWNPLAASQVVLASGLIGAIYKGVQDGRTAIRFFKKNYSENGNEFHIDPNRITVWGNGSGGSIALNMAAISHVDDFIFTTNSEGKFIVDTDGDGIPESPMILEETHGDIEGKNLTIAPYDFFGGVAGDTSNYENHPNYQSDFHLSVNVSGNVADISWLHNNQIPTITFQSNNDPYYSYGNEMLVFYPTGILTFETQGAVYIGELQDSLGNNQDWKDRIESGEPFTKQASLNSEIAGHPYYEGVYPFIDELNSNGFYEGVVIDWWDPNGASPINSPGMGMPWNEIPYSGSSEVSYHDYALLTNENMSAEKARANIDTIMNYFAPRACIALELEDCVGDVFTSLASSISSNTKIKLFPNPTSDQLTIDVGNEEIQSIQIFDSRGQLLKTFSFSKTGKKEIEVSDLDSGFYIVKVLVEDEEVSGKFIIKR